MSSNTTSKVITTKAGEALIAQMQAENKVLVIDKFIFANVPNRPDFPQREDLLPTEHVVHESAVHEQGRMTENSVIYSTTLASNVGPFTFNWSGLYCSEHNTLVAINFPAAVDKTVDGPGVTGNTLVRSFVLEYKGIAETTNITVDPASWQYDAHKRMSKMDNDSAQAIIDQNGKDWFIDDGFIVTPQSTAYNIKAGAGYVSGHRITLDFDRIVQAPIKPSFIYVDAYREGSPTGEWVTKFNFVVSPDEKDDYTDAQGVQHFVCKIAQVMEDGSVGDMRGIDNKIFQIANSLIAQYSGVANDPIVYQQGAIHKMGAMVYYPTNGEVYINRSDTDLLMSNPPLSGVFLASRIGTVFNVHKDINVHGYDHISDGINTLEIPTGLSGDIKQIDFKKGVLSTEVNKNILMLKKTRKGKTLYSSQLFLNKDIEVDANYINKVVIPFCQQYGYSNIEFEAGEWMFSDTINWVSGVAPVGVGVGTATSLDRIDQPSTVFKAGPSFECDGRQLFLFQDDNNLVVSSLQLMDFKIHAENKNISPVLINLAYDFVSLIDIMIDDVNDRCSGLIIDNNNDAYPISQTLYTQNLFVRKLGVTSNNNIPAVIFRRLQESTHILLKIFCANNSPSQTKATALQMQDCKSVTFFTPSFAHCYNGLEIISGSRTSTQISCYSPIFEGVTHRWVKAIGGKNNNTRISNIYVLNPRNQYPDPEDGIVYELDNCDGGFLDCGFRGALLHEGTSQVEVKAQRLQNVIDRGKNNYIHANPNAFEKNVRTNSGFENKEVKTELLKCETFKPQTQLLTAGSGEINDNVAGIITDSLSTAEYILPKLTTNDNDTNVRYIFVKHIGSKPVSFTCKDGDSLRGATQIMEKGNYILIGYNNQWIL
ncbi:TPA: phage tail protein [Photobacterium damselae]